MWSKNIVSDTSIAKAVELNKYMIDAAKSVGLKYNTFIRRAKKLNVYRPNKENVGLRKGSLPKYSIDDILSGKCPHYRTHDVKIRLIRNGIKKEICESCGQKPFWNDKKLVLQLDHVNGINNDHRLENLQLLCPNCHTQTSTYCGRNIKLKNKSKKYIYKQRKRKYGNVKDYHINVSTQWKDNQIKYVPMIINSNIDFNTFGWVGKVAKIINQKPQKVNKWMKIMMPDFLDKCFKRK